MRCDNVQWRPQSDSRVWIFTIEAAECTGTVYGCYRHEPTQQFVQGAVYRPFVTSKEFSDAVAEFCAYQGTISGFRDQIDSLVLQVSVHGADFRTMSSGGTAIRVDQQLMRGQLRPNRNTVILLNQCWGAWPTWPRLVSKVRECSPRFVFGSRKRHGTSMRALNRAEESVINWLGGGGDLSSVELTGTIHRAIGTQYPSHEEFYRVWYWSEGTQVSFPRAKGGQFGEPSLAEYWLQLGDCHVHLLVPTDEDDVEDAKAKLLKLCGTYSVVKHKPHTEKGQYHLHVLKKGKDFFALNQDGTTHDHIHGITIPPKVAEALRSMYPKFVLPKNNFVKMAYCLCE